MTKGSQVGARSQPSWRTSQYEEILDLAEQIYHKAMALDMPDFSQVDMTRGFEVSAAACQQQVEVPISPIMKNILKQKGDFKSEDWKLLVDSPPTKGEKWLNEVISQKLNSLNGPKTDKYDEDLPLDDKHHYDVDCWRNFKENMRQIQPGQAETRMQLSIEFGKRMDPEPLFKLFREDGTMKEAILFMFDYMPVVRAATDYSEFSGIFQSKHSDVGYPWWYNDRVVDAKSGKTYGQMAEDYSKTLRVKDLPKHAMNTAFARNQMKGRLIIAMDRIVNLSLNRLEAEEIKKLKSVSYFVGYNDDIVLKEALSTMLKFCISNGYKCANWDQSKFDLHINPAWLALIGAMRMMKANGALGKELAEMRAMLSIHGWLVNGMTGKVEEIFGRMFSGLVDTNQGDSWVESIAMTYCLMRQDHDYKKMALRSDIIMAVMGDDALLVDNPKVFDHDTFVRDMESIGFEVNKEKGEFGVFFLQNRLFRANNDLVMVYPWTRVLRSLLFPERKKGLGPYGWLLAQYQQLSKLSQYPPALDAVISIIYPYDKLKLGVDLTVGQILEGVKSEDQEAAAASNSAQFTSTAKRLYDGDPTKSRQFEADGSISKTYLASIHKIVKESVNRLGRANMRSAVKSGKPETTQVMEP